MAVKFCWELGPSLVNFPFSSLPVLPQPTAPRWGLSQHAGQRCPGTVIRRDHCPSTFHGHLYTPPPPFALAQWSPRKLGLGLLTLTLLSSVTTSSPSPSTGSRERQDSLKHPRRLPSCWGGHWLANGKVGHSVP